MRDEDGNRHLAEFGWPMRSAESGSQSDVNEWQKSGNRTGALKGHLWVLVSAEQLGCKAPWLCPLSCQPLPNV